MILKLPYCVLCLSFMSTMIIGVISHEKEYQMAGYSTTATESCTWDNKNFQSLFEAKHFSEDFPSNKNAKKKSCERNFNTKVSSSPSNTVVFLRDTSIGYEGYERNQIAGGSCGAYFTKMFYCTNIPKDIKTQQDLERCIQGTLGTCHQCNSKFQDPTRRKDYGYYATIYNESGEGGHFETECVHWIEASTNTFAGGKGKEKCRNSNICSKQNVWYVNE